MIVGMKYNAPQALVPSIPSGFRFSGSCNITNSVATNKATIIQNSFDFNIFNTSFKGKFKNYLVTLQKK